MAVAEKELERKRQLPKLADIVPMKSEHVYIKTEETKRGRLRSSGI